MKVGTRIESFDETTVTGKFGKDPQFNLRIVSDDEFSSCRMPAETTPVLHRVRHLLDVGIRTSKPSRRRTNLAKVRMQATSHRIN